MEIKFSQEERDSLVSDLQLYFEDELDHEIGSLGATLFLEFIEDKIAKHFYNRALVDAQEIIEMKLEDIKETLYATRK